MSSITRRGDSYRIMASAGRKVNGKQVRPAITWTPEPGMTAKQIEKELERTVSRRLGHSQTSTTSNIYSHAIESADARAAETLENILSPVSQRK